MGPQVQMRGLFEFKYTKSIGPSVSKKSPLALQAPGAYIAVRHSVRLFLHTYSTHLRPREIGMNHVYILKMGPIKIRELLPLFNFPTHFVTSWKNKNHKPRNFEYRKKKNKCNKVWASCGPGRKKKKKLHTFSNELTTRKRNVNGISLYVSGALYCHPVVNSFLTLLLRSYIYKAPRYLRVGFLPYSTRLVSIYIPIYVRAWKNIPDRISASTTSFALVWRRYTWYVWVLNILILFNFLSPSDLSCFVYIYLLPRARVNGGPHPQATPFTRVTECSTVNKIVWYILVSLFFFFSLNCIGREENNNK